MTHQQLTPPATLQDIRNQIDALDQAILSALSRRLSCSLQTRSLKRSIEDSGREAALRAQWLAEARELGLSPEFALEILVCVLKESKRLQCACV